MSTTDTAAVGKAVDERRTSTGRVATWLAGLIGVGTLIRVRAQRDALFQADPHDRIVANCGLVRGGLQAAASSQRLTVPTGRPLARMYGAIVNRLRLTAPGSCRGSSSPG